MDSLNQDVAKVTHQEIDNNKEVKKIELIEKDVKKTTPKRGKGRPKTSKRKPLNTAIDPRNRQRLEFLAMLNGGSIADQLNTILNTYFTEIERVDELIEIFEEKKLKR